MRKHMYAVNKKTKMMKVQKFGESLVSVHKVPVIFLSCPKPALAVSKQGSVVGHPELI